MIADALVSVTQAAMLAFVVATMIAMGLELTVRQVLAPLRQVRLVVLVLLANFVVVPAVAVLVVALVPMEEAAGTALLLLGCTAGAPFLPRLAVLSGGDVALSVAVMVLLMVLTVAYAPVVVPALVQGVSVDPLEVVGSLVLCMLLPLAAGLAVRARYPGLAAAVAGPTGHVAGAALLLGFSAGLLVSWRELLGALGSGIFVGLAVLLVAAFGAGLATGLARPTADRTVLGLATAQRNIAAALVVAAPLGGEVLVYTLVGALALPAVLLVVAGEVGRRSPGRERSVAP